MLRILTIDWCRGWWGERTSSVVNRLRKRVSSLADSLDRLPLLTHHDVLDSLFSVFLESNGMKNKKKMS